MFNGLKEYYDELEAKNPEAAAYFEEQIELRGRAMYNNAVQIFKLEMDKPKASKKKIKKKVKNKK